MATIYLRSADGSDSNDGSTKALAKASLQAAMTAAGSGGRVLAASDHSESIAAPTVLTSPGTQASPQEILSINWSTDALEAGASFVTTDSSHLYLEGSFLCNGWTFFAGSRLGRYLWLGGSYTSSPACWQTYEDCTLGGYGGVVVGLPDAGSNCPIEWRNCVWNVTRSASILRVGQRFTWVGGSISGTPGTVMEVYPHDSNPFVRLENVDLSGAEDYFIEPNGRIFDILLNRCLTHTSLVLCVSTPEVGSQIRLVECDHGTNFIRQAYQDYNGMVTEDTVRIRDDSNSTYSHKLVSSAYTQFYSPLRSFPVARYNAVEGEEITVRVEVLTDGVTLTDGEFWIEANYLGNASYPLGSIASSAKADILAAASNLATSSEGWTTTGLSTPVKQYAEVTFTPQKTGIIEITACLAKASTTVYVDPDATVS